MVPVGIALRASPAVLGASVGGGVFGTSDMFIILINYILIFVS
jgi:hypothetical protein